MVVNEAMPSRPKRSSWRGRQREPPLPWRGGTSNGTPIERKPIHANSPLLNRTRSRMRFMASTALRSSRRKSPAPSGSVVPLSFWNAT